MILNVAKRIKVFSNAQITTPDVLMGFAEKPAFHSKVVRSKRVIIVQMDFVREMTENVQEMLFVLIPASDVLITHV